MRTASEVSVSRQGGISHGSRYLFLLFGLLGLLLYSFLAISSKGIWSDEAFSFGMIRHSFRDIWNLTAGDVHPPLYYYYLKIFLMLFGDGLITARIASIIPFLFILLFGGWQLSRLFNGRTGALFMASFLAFPSILQYAYEVRMYSLAAAFVFANAVFAYRCGIFNKIPDWFWLVICSVGAAYTHDYAFLAIGLIDLLLLVILIWKKRSGIKCWVASFVFMVLMYLPWCGKLLGQMKYKVENEYWIKKITLKTICEYVYQAFRVQGFIYFAVFLAGAYFILFIWALWKRYEKAVLSLAIPVLVAVIGIIVSIIVRPVFIFRYLAPSLWAFPVFAAIVLDHMLDTKKNNKLVVGILSVILLAGGINAAGWMVAENRVCENPLDKTWVDQQDCDMYLVICSKPHASTVLACFEQEKTIYITRREAGDATPFSNIQPYASFCPQGKERIILLLDKGENPSEKIPDGYSCSYKEQIMEDDGCVFDVYELIP